MNGTGLLGRVLFGIAVLAFGVQHLVYAGSGVGLGPPWLPENVVLVWIVGIVLLVAGACIATGRQLGCAAMAVSLVMFVRALLCYAPRLAHVPRDPGPWTSVFELLAMCGVSLILAARLMGKHDREWRLAGRVLFALSLVVFGVQHLMYGRFIATLIPVWIPERVFWAYLVGVAFLAAALAIASGRLRSLAGTMLGGMLLLWVVILHAPRVAVALHNGNEWTSLFVALAFSGCGFVIAGASGDSLEKRV